MIVVVNAHVSTNDSTRIDASTAERINRKHRRQQLVVHGRLERRSAVVVCVHVKTGDCAWSAGHALVSRRHCVAAKVPPVAEGFGISKGGKDAEERFLALTGAAAADGKALGDAVLEGHHVEIKSVKRTTINQVRALKYLPLVLYNWPDDRWFVVPAHRIVADVANKRRGQHTEIAFESVNLSLKAYAEYEVAAGELREAVLERVAEAERFPELKDAMSQLLARLQATAEESRSAVREILTNYGLI